jgi:hypothetical protein
VKRKRTLVVAVVVALLGAGVAYAAGVPGAKFRKQDRVYGGGQIGPGCFSNSTICFANARNFAVDAHAQATGREVAGSSTYGAPGGADNYRTVTCVRVEGRAAAIGGRIVSGGNPGYLYVQYFVDRGGPAQGERDLASPAFIDPAGSAEWPAGFPNVCPSPSSGFAAAEPIFRAVDAGDVVVQDASG